MQMPKTSSSSLSAATPNGDELLNRAHEFASSLRPRSLEIARARKIPESVMHQLAQLGLLQLARPARYGGRDLPMNTIFKIGTALAAGDASVAWVYCVTNSHDHLVGLFPKEVQDAYWQSSLPLCASSYVPTGKAVPAAGGFRLSGKWSFCSGIDYCGWIVVGAVTGIIQGERPVPDLQLFMLKTADVEIIDDWQVMGLAGTGSKSISVNDLFVPKERVLRNLDVMNGETPGASLHANPLYRLSVWPLFGFSILAPTTGIARGAFELVVHESREKALAGDPAFESRRSTTQVHLAEAGALIDTAELLFDRGLTETYRLVIDNKPLPVDLRVRNRRDQAYLAGLCRKAVEILMGLAGGRGIREEGAIQRAFRDLYAISAHPGGNWDAASTSYGSVLLGGSPTEMFY